MTAETSGPIPTAHTLNGHAFAGRDRVLLYTRGMNIDPITGVSLALESLKRAGEGAAPDKVMEELYALLRERNPSRTVKSPDGSLLTSAPPMNRRSVVAKDMDQFSLTAGIIGYIRGLFATLRKKKENGA